MSLIDSIKSGNMITESFWYILNVIIIVYFIEPDDEIHGETSSNSSKVKWFQHYIDNFKALIIAAAFNFLYIF